MENCEADIYNQYYASMPTDQLIVRENVTTPSKNELKIRIYFSLITSIDRQIGRVLDKLDELGLTAP